MPIVMEGFWVWVRAQTGAAWVGTESYGVYAQRYAESSWVTHAASLV